MAILKDWPKGYQNKVEKILGVQIRSDGTVLVEFPYETKEQARSVKKQLIQIQKQLREVKREAGEDMIKVRAAHTAKKGKISVGFLASLAGKKAAEKDKKRRLDNLKNRQSKSLKPYETVQSTIDRMISELDKVKREVEDYIARGE